MTSIRHTPGIVGLCLVCAHSMASICHTPGSVVRGLYSYPWHPSVTRPTLLFSCALFALSFDDIHRHTPDIVAGLCVVVLPLKVASATASSGAPGGGSGGGGATAMEVDTPNSDSSGNRGKVSKRLRLGDASTTAPPSL